MNFLTEHGIDTYPDLESRVAEITAASDEAAAALKAMEHRLADMAVLIKNVTTYKQLRPVSMEYRKAKDKAQFRREHESTLILYEAAAKALKEQGVKKLPDLYALKAEYKRLAEEKNGCMNSTAKQKSRCRNTVSSSKNVDGILRVTPGKGMVARTMSIPRMNYPQYRKARKLVRECCNYCDGNCLLLDDGEECVCVQSIFLFAAMPVVPGCCPPAGCGPVYRDHERPRRGETLLRVWRCIYAEVQPGQILPSLRQTDAPPQRGRTTAEKVLAIYAFRALKRPVFRGFSCMVGGVVE